jgi:hypothetical protein
MRKIRGRDIRSVPQDYHVLGVAMSSGCGIVKGAGFDV